MPTNGLACELLRPNQVEAAIRSLRDHSDLREDGRGIRILVDEPELYNKWLYTVPGPGESLRLFGLSRRFCPFTNRRYAGGSPYHSGLTSEDALIPTLRGAALRLLRLPENTPREGLVRGPMGRLLHSSEWASRKDIVREVWEIDADPKSVAAERGKTTWEGVDGPTWTGTDLAVRPATSREVQELFQLQNNLNSELGLGAHRHLMWAGITEAVAYSKRHNYLTMFTRGLFLVAVRSNRLVGSAWCYRSFNPLRSGWTVWVRYVHVLPGCRRTGVFRGLLSAAPGVFAEAGYPTRQRVLLGRESPARDALTRYGFQLSKDDYFE